MIFFLHMVIFRQTFQIRLHHQLNLYYLTLMVKKDFFLVSIYFLNGFLFRCWLILKVNLRRQKNSLLIKLNYCINEFWCHWPSERTRVIGYVCQVMTLIIKKIINSIIECAPLILDWRQYEMQNNVRGHRRDGIFHCRLKGRVIRKWNEAP